MTSSSGVPSASQTTKVRCTPRSIRASSAGPASAVVSTATLGWARQMLAARRSRPPCTDTTWASSQAIPARAKAVATEETAGSTSSSSPYSGRRRVRTTPKKPGSPSATTTAVPRCSASRWAAAAMLPRAMRSAPAGTGSAFSW